MSDTRSGYLLEHQYSNIQVIDETEKQKEFPDHSQCVGPLLVWREDIVPSGNGEKDKKLTYYRLRKNNPLDPKKPNDLFVALLTNYDQNLSSLSIATSKKQADPESQRKISRIILFLSFSLNIFLVVQDSLNPDEQLIVNVTPSNAGWLLFFFALFKIIDLLQERPAVFSAIYVQYWAKVYNPSEKELVDVAFCRMLLTDKIRINDKLPVAIEEEHILLHSVNRKKAEDKYEAEYNEKLQIQRTSEDQKKTITESETRIKAREKEAYLNGVRDGSHSIVLRSNTKELIGKYPEVTWPATLIVVAVLFYLLLRSISVSFPEAIFIVELAEFPVLFWVFLFVLSFFALRWLFTFLGAFR